MERFFSLASVLVLAAGMSAAQTSNASAAHKHSKAAPAASDAAPQPATTGDANSAANSTTTQPGDAVASQESKAATSTNDVPRNNGISDSSANVNRAESRGNGSNWGWIGLFGLLGLLPRGNKNRVVTPMRSIGTDTGRERIRRVG